MRPDVVYTLTVNLNVGREVAGYIVTLRQSSELSNGLPTGGGNELFAQEGTSPLAFL